MVPVRDSREKNNRERMLSIVIRRGRVGASLTKLASFSVASS
jgi:hypothetical protein